MFLKVLVSSYSITGNASYHFLVNNNGTIIVQGMTITLTGTPAFSYFANAAQLGMLLINNNTWAGSATGSRYSAALNGAIRCDGATLPGDAAGTTATGGQVS